MVRAPARGVDRRARPAGGGSGAVRLWLGSEIVFAVAFAAMVLLVAYSPDVWGTEKPMDMAFVNAANASTSFPPHDPWMSGEELNYYYLGHLAMAIVIKVVGTAPGRGLQPRLRAARRRSRRPRCSRSPARCGRPPGRG